MNLKEHRWSILVLVAAVITFIAFYLPWVHMTVKDVTPVIEGYDMVSYNVGSDDYRVSGSDLMKQYGKIKLTVVVTKAQVNSAQDVAKIDLLDFSAKKWDAALPQPVDIEGDPTYFGFAVGTILIAALAASSIARPPLRKTLMLVAIGIVILMLGLHFWKFYSLQQINDIDETLGRASTNSTKSRERRREDRLPVRVDAQYRRVCPGDPVRHVSGFAARSTARDNRSARSQQRPLRQPPWLMANCAILCPRF